MSIGKRLNFGFEKPYIRVRKRMIHINRGDTAALHTRTSAFDLFQSE
jgi:hypothetical protein